MTVGKGNLTRGVEITIDACRVLVEIPTHYNDLELAHNGFFFCNSSKLYASNRI